MRAVVALAGAIALIGLAPTSAGAAARLDKKSKGLKISYSMPDRFGKLGTNGLVRYPTGKQIAPRAWRVNFVVRRKDGDACKPSDSVRVSAPRTTGARFIQKRRNPCRFYGMFPSEGRYAVSVTLKSGQAGQRELRKGSRRIAVQDWLIFGLGDSNGSGEGTPDAPSGLLGFLPPKWQDASCDRSANAYQAQAARAIERRDRRTSVTFVHRACSGASIASGLVGPYAGISGGRAHAPQIGELQTLAQGREIDAVILSVGANDVGFFSIVMHCIEYSTCPQSAFPGPTSGLSLEHVVDQRLAALPERYDTLAGALKGAGIPAGRVFITEYFDPTKDARGQICDPLMSTPMGTVDHAEAAWASDQFLSPLNRAIRAAAQKHGWQLVAGAQAGFRTHGYCSSDPWIVSVTDSLTSQGNLNGTLHSTRRGNAFQADLAYSSVRKELYRNGRARIPAASRSG